MNITLMKEFDRAALAGVDFEFSYADTYARIIKARDALPHADGERKIAVFAENSPQWVFALYGAWLDGATVVPIDAKSNAEEAAFILSDAEPDAVCVGRENLDTAREAVEKSGNRAKIVVLEDLFEGELPKPESRNWKIERDSDALALIVYTSGTTGNPKGVMLTFGNMYANMRAVYDARYYFDGIRVLALLPFHHILPLMGTLVMPLSIGGRLSFPKSLSPSDIGEVLQKYPVDMIISVPRFYELLHANIMAKIRQSKIASALFNAAKLANSPKLSRLLFGAIQKKFGGEVKFWISGGAALDKRIWRDLDVLGFGIREGYGMTECAPIIAFPRIGRIRVGSPGEALPGIEIRIVEGEIIVRGDNVTRGYYKRPEETAESIKNGWLYTGDLGYLDENGYLFITGRRKEIIVLPNGKNINPSEMETQLKRQSGDELLEAGILMYDNMLQAVIRVSPEMISAMGKEGAEEHVRNDFILPYNRATASYKRIIKFVLTTDELPRTRVGKLKRHLLPTYIESRNLAEPQTARPEPDSETYRELKCVLADQISLPVRPDAHMEMDLGLDSLGKIAIKCYVKENYGVEVGERDFEKHPSLREFAKLVDDNRDNSFENQSKNITWSDIIKSEPFPTLPKPNFFHFLSIDIFRTFARLFYKVSFEGLENIATDKPVIIAPNHQSYLDGLFVVLPFSKTQIYKTYFFAKVRNIIKSGWIKNYANRSNVIVMDINDNVIEAVRKLAEAVREGNRIVVFPEGTRTKDGAVAEFKQTFAIIAKEMGVAVVPVAITGAFEAVKSNATLPTFGAKIGVRYLPPMTANEGEPYADFAARVKTEVENACKRGK